MSQSVVGFPIQRRRGNDSLSSASTVLRGKPSAKAFYRTFQYIDVDAPLNLRSPRSRVQSE
jgi:hypothetical protein